ncbi:hypothetical protein MmiEs2_09130 [Methanimicrococcus stummii]|uniref:Uncharacterized protein n=1 Tax=Methanimicrococcus stummii TaxID=3028294 RepID=A0AA96VAH6_9EURY|nr:hypothetical protein MmiEs2_09130 [Methanimicrococcus sp. Es2]
MTTKQTKQTKNENQEILIFTLFFSLNLLTNPTVSFFILPGSMWPQFRSAKNREKFVRIVAPATNKNAIGKKSTKKTTKTILLDYSLLLCKSDSKRIIMR